MVDYVKQDMTYLWGSSGDIVQPATGKIQQGWLVEVVPRQWWNWMQNRADTNIAYLLQKGFPEWDTLTEYVINKSYVQRSGIVYKCIQTGINQDPTTATAYWVKAFPESSAALEALRVLTPSADTFAYYTSGSAAALTTITAFARTLLDDVDATAMRATISAQPLDATLTAIAGASTGTNILHYFSGTDTVATTTLSAFGRTLIDDADATAGRATLGLGTAATATVTTSQYDSTAARLLKVGDFGLGASTYGAIADFNTLTTKTGFYAADSGSNRPSGFVTGSIIHINVSDTAGAQIAMSRNPANRVWTRSATGSVWSAWVEQFHSGNVTAFVQTLLDDPDAATFRTTLDVYDKATVDGKQPLDATLTAIAGVTTAADTITYFNGVDTAASTPLTSFARSILDDADAATVRATISAQASDATLTALAGLTTTGDRLPYFTGVDTAAVTTFSAFARTLLDDADATTMRATLGAQPLDATLTAIAGMTTGADFLPYFTGVDTVSSATFTAFARSLVAGANALAARGTLGLGTSSTVDITTSTTDSTIGRVLKVNDYGIGGTVPFLSSPNLTSDFNTGTYYCTTPSNGPVAGQDGYLTVRRASSLYFKQSFTLAGTASLLYERVCINGSWSPWRLIFDQGNSVGTVSQSGGVPTGAIFETGSNANGRYVKFADGTMICTVTHTAAFTMNSYSNIFMGVVGKTLPATFVGNFHGAGSGADTATVGWVSTVQISASTFNLYYYSGVQTHSSTDIRLTFVGRWF